ncbi:MAG: ABC transporter permease [Pirellulales bacterium]|nr:ABC transporter permease [Pirellulales bacterium]
MSLIHLILLGLRHHWRMHLAVALGVVAGTAVLTGALLVGDSMRGSLRHIVVDRLGATDSILVAPQFFRRELAAELAARPEFGQSFTEAIPAIVLQGTLELPGDKRRASGVDVFGTESRFWKLDPNGPQPTLKSGEVALNEPLAKELGAQVGDEVIVRLPRLDAVPADSPLGRKTETIRNRRLKVSAILPAAGLGRFGIRPDQQWPLNAFVDLDTLASSLGEPTRINAIFVAGNDPTRAAGAQLESALSTWLQPTLADYGVTLERTPQGYLNLTSDRMMLEPALVRAAEKAVPSERRQSSFTYLANDIRRGDFSIPYSTIAAIDPRTMPPLGPFLTSEGQPLDRIGDDEIVLNRWAADDLEAKPGDEISLTYFEPESTHGEVVEKTTTLRLKAIVELEGAARDPDFTPKLEGVTDVDSMGDWDPPFPFDAARIRSDDEQYWDDYRTTPKAFVSLATGRRLWGSRFGDTTTIRFVPDDSAKSAAEQVAALAAAIRPDPAEMGLRFIPVKRMGLMAASGTTPFGLLFLGFSMFIIASAGMLIALLFRLGVESRASELGVLAAVGTRWRRARLLLAGEGLSVAALAAVVGVLVGVGYAWLMLVGLRTWWLAAVSTPFLELYATPTSLIAGYVAGVFLAATGMHWAVARLGKQSARQLLSGQVAETPIAGKAPSRWPRRIAYSALALAALLTAVASRLVNEAQAGAFFGSGMLVLIALLLLLRSWLATDSARSLIATGRAPLVRLALRNGGRHPGRTTLTVGLVATASFLIVAIGAFRLDPPGDSAQRDTGTGGFALLAESDQPIYEDLNAAWNSAAPAAATSTSTNSSTPHVFALRRRVGDDASCLNLFQPSQPEVLGVPRSLIERGGFAWAASAANTREEQANPWLLLEREPGKDARGNPIVPVVLDQNTAMYSLHLYGGPGSTYEIEDDAGRPVTLEVVGLLKNSILQGDVLMAEANFRRLFPNVSGYRFFLIDATQAQTEQIAKQLEGELGDYGFDATRPAARLASFFAVQNTYLATFQSLGGLGLLLGTFGLATVELRNVLERRSELALLRATGFRRRRLAGLVLLENATLLVLGLAIGVFAALVAISPHLLGGSAGLPFATLAATLGLVLIAGLLAGFAAVRTVLRAPLVPALRGD